MVKLWVAVFAFLSVCFFINCLPTSDVNDFRKLIKPNTQENIEKLKNLGEDDLAELYGGQYQGDIVLEDEVVKEIEGLGKNAKTGLIALRYRWAGSIVPYIVEEKDFSAEQIAYIHRAAREMEAVTCLRFVTYDPRIHNDYVRVIGSDSGCYSYVGRRGTGEQLLNLQVAGNQGLETGCFRLYTIVHEFMHAIGFYHMQSATERDEYVEIVFEKIQPSAVGNFNIYAANVITNHGVEYDYGSVMHYPRTAFSIDGSDTIVALRPLNGETMGQRLRMSEKDIARMNNAYCDGVAPTTTPEPPQTTRIPNLSGLGSAINNLVNNIFNNIWGALNRGS